MPPLPSPSSYRIVRNSLDYKRWEPYIAPVVPYAPDHKIDASSPNPSLDTIPDAGHGSSIEDRPQCAPDAKRGTRDNREGYVISSSNSAGQAYKASSDTVTKLYDNRLVYSHPRLAQQHVPRHKSKIATTTDRRQLQTTRSSKCLY